MVFVYYNDDYCDNGGVGLERFEDRTLAEKFILKRLKMDDRKIVTNYTVIEGQEMPIKIVQTIHKIKIGG